MRPKTRLSSPQIIKIYNRLNEVLEIVDRDQNLVRYTGDHHDASIAAEFGVSVNHVCLQRTTNFGKFYHKARAPAPAPAAPPTSAEQRLDALDSRLTALEKALGVSH